MQALLAMGPNVDMKSAFDLWRTEAEECRVLNEHFSSLKFTVAKKDVNVMLVEFAREVETVLDIVKVVDVVILLIAPSETNDISIDFKGDFLLSMIQAQGVPTIAVGIPGLSQSKKPLFVKKQTQRYINTFFPTEPIVRGIESKEDIHAILRSVCVSETKLTWRESRGYFLAHSANVLSDNKLEMIGYLNGSHLSTRSLLCVTGWGDFQMESIEVIHSAGPVICSDLKNSEEVQTVVVSTSGAPVDSLEAFQNVVDEIEDEEMKVEVIRNVKNDTLSAWREAVPDEDNDHEDTLSVIETEESMQRKKKELQALERDALQFPDEVDTPIDQPARVRFARYRGLANVATSEWDPRENLPKEYGRIYAFENFERTMREVKKEDEKVKRALEQLHLRFSPSSKPEKESEMEMETDQTDGVLAGVQIRVVLLMSDAISSALLASQKPIICSSLYEHEHKVSVVHFLLRRRPEHQDLIKGKTLMIFNCGFRKILVRPVFSEDGFGHGDKHLIHRYFKHEEFTVATCYCPVMFPSAPLLAFLPNLDERFAVDQKVMYGFGKYIASGHLLTVDPLRLNIKRIILTGYCIRVSKRTAVVRFMFFQPDDVNWFSPVKLRTKAGLIGEIKSSVGTKGNFKCVFNEVIQQNDVVCMHLYKRQYPKWDDVTMRCLV